jgi:3-phytase/alkaline phosphatase D
MKKRTTIKAIAFLAVSLSVHQSFLLSQRNEVSLDPKPGKEAIVRFATFNVSFNRKNEGQLKKELLKRDGQDPSRIAEIIQRVRPDILLINEFDFDAKGTGLNAFAENYLSASQNEQQPIEYPFVYFAPVNTGVDSSLDLNKDGKLGTANDAFGFGNFPGQYGMAVYSKFPIGRNKVRTFQKFLWKDMPDCLWPIDPKSQKPFYDSEIEKVFRLSSKSHWDVPIHVGEQTIHFLVAHPTPPVFDGEEDRNGRRNHDEIRFFADYVQPEKSAYIYDDQGVKGGLYHGAKFVIAGDMNADENDGDSTMDAAKLLTTHSLINHSFTPESKGGAFYAKKQGKANLKQVGDPSFDTGDFNDLNVGNLHLDYCLPSANLKAIGGGVYWPTPDQDGANLVSASDHRLVWVDILK